MARKIKPTKISKRTTFDRLSLSAKFNSGASLKYSISRNGEKLDLAFSNDATVLKEQSRIICEWLDSKKETNQERIDRLEEVCKKVNSGKEFIDFITKK